MIVSYMFSKAFLALGFLVALPIYALGKQPIIFESDTTIVGAGIVGGLHAYFSYKDASRNGQKIKITILEKNNAVTDTTAANICPSLTPDEILCVIPRGKLLVEKLAYPFNHSGGIRVDDVANVNDAPAAAEFIEQAEIYGEDIAGYNERTHCLLEFGKMSMDLWQKIYDEADATFKAIMIAANFNPCCEIDNSSCALHEGYRIDLIYNIPNAQARALAMINDYQKLGYAQCRILTPSEVIALDPFLADFCSLHSEFDDKNISQWHHDSVALWRPGGCLDAKVFLPKLYDYLQTMMGDYIDEAGSSHSCFEILYNHEVKRIMLEQAGDTHVIIGLAGDNFTLSNYPLSKKHEYIFCPGQAVGTLRKLGLQEPAYAGFAGVSLCCAFPRGDNNLEEYKQFNHCMEVHQEGVVLAWQGRATDAKVFLNVAGTKAFYADQAPHINHAFAKDRNLLQLNMINDVVPALISNALDRNTKGQVLSQEDLNVLEQKEIAKRWAGVRAVAFDGFPTLGKVYLDNGGCINNALVTTHLGSGGISFGPAAVVATRSTNANSAFMQRVLTFAQSNRRA